MDVSQETVNQVMQRLDALAAKLGVTAQYIYGVYVQQAHVEAIRDVLIASLFLPGGVGLVYLAYRLFKWGAAQQKYDVDWPFAVGFFAGLLGVFLGALSCCFGYSALGAWLNPQFWALDALFKAVK